MKKATAFITLIALLGILSGTVYLFKFYPTPQDFTPIIDAVKSLVQENVRVPALVAIAIFWTLSFLLSIMVLFASNTKNDNKASAQEADEKAVLQKKIEQYEAETIVINDKLILNEKHLATEKEKVEKLKEEVEELQLNNEKAIEAASNNTEHQDELKKLNSQIEELISSRDNAVNDKSEIEKKLNKNSSELEAMIEKVQSIEEKQKSYKKEAEKARSCTNELSKDIEKINDAYEATKKLLQETQQELESNIANTKGGTGAIPPAAFQILYLLQKEGRLIDLLMEDVTDFDDETLGGAIRPIHEGCRKLLQDRLIIEPVLNEEEGTEITLEKLDSETVKLSGNVPSEGPYTGELIHRGWRLKKCNLPELIDGWSGNVVAPAEIEIL